MLNNLLLELKNQYNSLERRQYDINAKWHGKRLNFKKGLEGFEDGFNFTFDFANVAENCISINFYMVEDGKKVGCVEYISFEQFEKHFSLLNS